MIGLLAGPDPVAAKELRGVSRRWWTYVGRCLLVGATAYLIYQFWTQTWGPPGAAMVSVSEYAQLGREIFTWCEWTALALSALSAVIGGADMIAREARQGTLDLLFLTRLSPSRVILGKWKAAMLMAGSLYLCVAPVLAVSVFLRGVGVGDLLRSASFTLGLASAGAALSIRQSARLRSPGMTVAATLPGLAGVFVALSAADGLGTLIHNAWGVPGALPHRGGILASLAAVGFTVGFLRQTSGEVGQRLGRIPGPSDLARERRALALDELREARRSTPPRILRTWRAVWEDNPLVWKEFTLRPALRIREDWRVRVHVAAFFLLGATRCLLPGGTGGPFFNLWGLVFAVVALTAGSLLFAPEKEGRQWLLLLSTPVTPGQVVGAKLGCGLLFPEVWPLLLLYAFFLVAWQGAGALGPFAARVGFATLFLLFAYFLAASCSLRARTARGAFVSAAAGVSALVVLPPLLVNVFRSLGLAPGAGEGPVWEWVAALDPVAVLASLDEPRPTRAHPVFGPSVFTPLSLRYLALYLPVTALLPLEMVWRFRRIAVRA